MKHRVIDDFPRQTFLVAYGLVYLIIGLGWVGHLSPAQENAITWLPPFLTHEGMALLWGVSGAITILCGLAALCHKTGERLGFFLLQLAPLLVTMYFIMAQLIFILPPPSDGGSPNGLLSASLYLAIYIPTVLMARVRTPQDITRLMAASSTMTGAITIHKREGDKQ